MRPEPSSSRRKTNSSSPESICSRRLGYPAESIPGVEVAGRRRTAPAARRCHRHCRSCSCRHWSRSRCSCCRYSCWNRGSRVNRGWNNRASRDCDNHANHGCGNRYSNSLAAVDNWSSEPADRRSLVGRQRGPDWQRRRGPGSAQHPAASERCCLGLIYCILRMLK